MCRRTQTLGAALAAFGLGLILSALLGGGVLPVLLGVLFLAAGLLAVKQPY